MRYALLLFAVVLVAGLPHRSDACDVVSARTRLPNQEAARAVGIVTGYGLASRAAANAETIPSLLVRVDEVVSGGIAAGDMQVLLLFYGPDCHSTPFKREELERMYPLGSAVVVSGVATRRPAASAAPVIIAEMNQGGFVVTIPGNVIRTAEGDLDFQRFDPVPSAWQFLEFEFDRAVLTLRHSEQVERFARLRNLAYYPGFSGLPAARQWYDQLVSESNVTSEQRRVLLDSFEQVHRKTR